MGIMGPVDTSYESEHTKFIRELMARHPEIGEDQRKGRAIWWDRPPMPAAQDAAREQGEPAKAYPYDVNFRFPGVRASGAK
jgi:hypothetical protein